jgi:hypothetical protein
MADDGGVSATDEDDVQPTTPLGDDPGVTAGEPAGEPQRGRDRVLVVTPQGMSVSDDTSEENLVGMVEQPAKVMRIGSMIKQLLEEVRSAPLDEAGRARLADVHSRTIAELETGLSDDLVQELRRIALPFAPDAAPSDAELRIAQAQLVGWLEGLFHGIQTTLFAQQMAARAQLEQMRRQALPGPVLPGQPAQDAPGTPGDPGDRPHRTGQYL